MKELQFVSMTLKRDKNGIWYANDGENISYPSDGNRACFAVEDDSFWFGHRNNCIISVVKSFPPENDGAIFDIGGGNGFVSAGLSHAGFEIVLVEPGREGCEHARQRGIEHVICATTETARFKPGALPAVGLFDVIEHIEDDLAFLKSMHALMEEGGRLYATVPAYSFLWSQEDITAGHFRRYTLGRISGVLRDAGFEVEFSSYIFRFLPLPVLLLRALPYRLGLSKEERQEADLTRDHATGGGVIKKVLALLLKAETRKLDRRKVMRFGGSCLVVARKSWG